MAKLGKPRTAKGLATLCAKLADQKLAQNILIIDLEGIEFSSSDYFVVCSCESNQQIRALADHIKRQCKTLQITAPKIEGLENLQWVLIDFFDVVMHIMLPDVRSYYNLEKLWGDAKAFELSEKGSLIRHQK